MLTAVKGASYMLIQARLLVASTTVGNPRQQYRTKCVQALMQVQWNSCYALRNFFTQPGALDIAVAHLPPIKARLEELTACKANAKVRGGKAGVYIFHVVKLQRGARAVRATSLNLSAWS